MMLSIYTVFVIVLSVVIKSSHTRQ